MIVHTSEAMKSQAAPVQVLLRNRFSGSMKQGPLNCPVERHNGLVGSIGSSNDG
jgi:hypothetical protein